jgi:hypothetical protein
MATTLSSTQRTTFALRCLLAAWLADAPGSPLREDAMVRGLLADPAWRPSQAVVDELAPSFRQWAEGRGLLILLEGAH